MQPPPKLTTNLVQIQQAARDVTLGQIGINEFGALVTRLQQLFQAKLDDVRQLVRHEVPADFMPEIADEMNVGQRGVELYIGAMDEFFEYIRTRDLEHIQRGLQMSRDANDLVNEAMVRNWQTYQTYQQAAEEFVRQAQFGAPPT